MSSRSNLVRPSGVRRPPKTPPSGEFAREEIDHIRQGEHETVGQRVPSNSPRPPNARRVRVSGATHREAQVDRSGGAPLRRRERRAERSIRGR